MPGKQISCFALICNQGPALPPAGPDGGLRGEEGARERPAGPDRGLGSDVKNL